MSLKGFTLQYRNLLLENVLDRCLTTFHGAAFYSRPSFLTVLHKQFSARLVLPSFSLWIIFFFHALQRPPLPYFLKSGSPPLGLGYSLVPGPGGSLLLPK